MGGVAAWSLTMQGCSWVATGLCPFPVWAWCVEIGGYTLGFHIATCPGLASPSHPGRNGRGTRGLQLVPALGTRSPTQHCLLNTHCAWDSGPSHYLSNKKIWMLTTLALCSRDLVNSVLALERCCPRPCPILPTLRSVALVTGSLPLPKCLMLAPSPSPCPAYKSQHY